VKTLTAYKAHLHEIGKLSSALALLQWDQRTYLPEKAHEARAETIGKIAKLLFEAQTADKLGRYLERLEAEENLSPEDRASVRVVARTYRRYKAIPPKLYERFAVARARSELAWEKAKAASDFGMFLPHLEEMIDFLRRFSEYYGYRENPYDALIDEYEPGMTRREVAAVIAPLRESLVPFLKRLLAEGIPPETRLLRGTFPVDRQRTLSLRALQAIGYDFAAGRLDTTVHPFTSSTGPSDVRVTTCTTRGSRRSFSGPV
jgi:carboxypeptidase Taq